MPYTATITVRFHHTDAAGIVYFANIFQFFHVAFEELLDAAGLPLSGFFEQPDWLFPLVHAEADFVRPLRVGETVFVDVTPKPGERGNVAFAFVIRDEGGVRATGSHVHRAVDMRTFRPRDLPEGVASALVEAAR